MADSPGSDHDADPLLRTPPHNYAAEQALLGAILIDNRALETVGDYLLAEHFADPGHALIFKAIVSLARRGQIANPITLKGFLSAEPDLQDLGGDAYLAQLVGSAATIINAADYGRLIFELHLRRELIGLGEDMVNAAFDPAPEDLAKEQIEIAERRLFDLATTGESKKGFLEFKVSLRKAIENLEAAQKRAGRLSGVTTGLRDLDDILGGLRSSDLIILAGRPAMGKTALAANIAFNAARALRYDQSGSQPRKVVEGAIVAFFSLEMSADQLAARILSERGRIDSKKFLKAELTEADFENLVVASQEINDLSLYIDDTPGLSVSAIRARARRLHRTQGLGLIVIDYLQLLTGTPGKRSENRVQELSEITRSLKGIAKELNVPVLALSQLSRGPEQREDKRPHLSDLRESGSIEQDADVVMFVFREEYYLKAEPIPLLNETKEKFGERYANWQERLELVFNTAEVIVAKQRHGPTDTVKLFFDGRYTLFGNLDRDKTRN